jgi:hypothetical protein
MKKEKAGSPETLVPMPQTELRHIRKRHNIQIICRASYTFHICAELFWFLYCSSTNALYGFSEAKYYLRFIFNLHVIISNLNPIKSLYVAWEVNWNSSRR